MMNCTQAKTISILCINDFHAEIFENEPSLGAAKLVTMVERFKQTHANTIVVFGGDNYWGDPVSSELDGKPVTSLMKILGVKVSAVGNHEFDYSLDKLREWQQQGEYDFLAANVIDKHTGQIADGFQPYRMLQVADVSIAFIGLSTQERLDRMYYPEQVRNLQIVDGAQAARFWVDYLISGQAAAGRPDVIIALTHFGMKMAAHTDEPIGDEVMELCRLVPEIDGVFTAHWHQFISTRIHGVPVVQGGSGGRGAALLRVELAPDNRVREVTPQHLDWSRDIHHIPPHADTAKLFDGFKQQAMHTLGKIVARSATDVMHKCPLTAEVDMEGTPFTKLALDTVSEKTGISIVLLYSGRMGVGLRQGDWTLYDLYKMFFFNDEIIVMKVSGANLLSNIENGICTLRKEQASPLAVGGLRVTANYSKPYGSRVEQVTLPDGSSLAPDQEYMVAVDEFLAANEMGYHFAASNMRRTGVRLRDILIQAIQDKGTVPNELPNTMKVKNKPAPNILD